MVSADRQLIMETNRSLRNIKTVSRTISASGSSGAEKAIQAIVLMSHSGVGELARERRN